MQELNANTQHCNCEHDIKWTSTAIEM